MNAPIGIFGGTFDPVHKGHLAIAKHVYRSLPLDHIEWIPCHQPAHRQQPIASPTHRLAMVKLAIENHPEFQVNACEIARGGISYMVDTLNTLRAENPKSPLCLLLGADAFAHLNQWHKWESLLSLAHLVIINRPNTVLPKADWLETLLRNHQSIDKNDLTRKLAGQIIFETIAPMHVSSSRIREQLEKGLKPKHLPVAVWEYIQNNSLYQVK